MNDVLSLLHMPVFLLALPVTSTLTGGLVAARFRRWRPVLVAVGAGLLLGAAFLDLLPEAVALGVGAGLNGTQVMGLTLGFFLAFAMIESALDRWSPHADQPLRSRRAIGRVAGAMMIFHSFRDGMAIGAAFAASHVAGYAVATGIVAHDFGDGMNTMLLTTRGERATRSDYLFLLLDAVAPFLGGLLTVWWMLSTLHVTLLLTLAAGFFLQMATSDFLPQLKLERSRRTWLMFGVVAGAAVIYGANLVLGH